MGRKRRAVFLDRDGTLIEDVGVLSDPNGIQLLPGTVEALRLLARDYLLFVVTNQPGIARGLVTSEQVESLNALLGGILSRMGVAISHWYVCPHAREEGCACIKPNPAFLLQAASRYDIDLSRSFMIGDHPHDVLTGDSVGVFGLYLMTGHGARHLEEVPLDKLIFHTLKDAAEWLMRHPSPVEALQGDVNAGAEAIRQGGVVAFPTETVYGLGADAMNARAVARIYEIKKRPPEDPVIVHVCNRFQVGSLVRTVPDKAEMLMNRFWPGPLTLVLPKSAAVPDIVTAGNPTVAVRMPANPYALDLIRLADTPIAAPSANRFGCISPTTAGHVKEQLGNSWDVLIDGGACRVGIESTVLSLAGEEPVILRLGGISQSDIERAIGPVQNGSALRSAGGKYDSPGMMPKHYAPSTPLIITRDIRSYSQRSDVGCILLRRSSSAFRGPVEYLSCDGDLREAAGNLYRAMRLLDAMSLSLIAVERVPDTGLGAAINDRLSRAASKSFSGTEP